MKSYKHGNGRIQFRRAGGQFQTASLEDFGIGSRICTVCGSLNTYQTRVYIQVGGFVDCQRADPPTICSGCGLNFDTGATYEQEFNALIGEG